MKLPTGMRVAGVDDIDLYLNATTSHDGTRALRIDASPVRVVCKNTQRASFRASKAHYTFRHTSNVTSQISQCREAMGLMWDFMTEFEKQAERMINETLTRDQFEKITAQLWPLADDAGKQAIRNHKQRKQKLRYLLSHADTNEGIAGTHWGGYQAITEYVDHYAPAPNDATRALRAVSANMADLKTRAFELLSV
jgi:phage/plasmid-like protein (TIGR03299 family)